MVLRYLKKLLLSKLTASGFFQGTHSKQVSVTKNAQSEKITMKSTKPYLFEALYKCITDSDLTPLMLARSDILGVKLPKGFDQDQTIVLDLSYDAITDLVINNRYIAFEAIFDDVPFNVHIPMSAVLSIRCKENDIGIDFAFEPEQDNQERESESDGGDDSASTGKPTLRVL